jgi:hypothetical protein
VDTDVIERFSRIKTGISDGSEPRLVLIVVGAALG